MAKTITKIMLQMIAGANVATIVAMLVTGYSGYINPAVSPWLANAALVFPVFLFLNFAFLIFWLFFKPLYAIIPFVGMVIGFTPIRTYCPFNIPSAAPEGAIKVMSYNVWGYGTDKNVDGTNIVVQYIADSDADIVCLQEANASAEVQAQIDSLLYTKYAYHDTLQRKDKGGLAILSRFPIRHKEVIDYPSAGNLSGAFLLDIDGDDVVVICNHLETTGLTLEERENFKDMLKGNLENHTVKTESKRLIDQLGESARTRAPQAQAVARYIRKHAYQSIICMGDFNDSPLSYAHHTIDKELTDCYVASGNGPGISYHLSGFYVRIDNIFCSDDWEPYGCTVDRSVKASDHYPIMGWLKKKGGNNPENH